MADKEPPRNNLLRRLNIYGGAIQLLSLVTAIISLFIAMIGYFHIHVPQYLRPFLILTIVVCLYYSVVLAWRFYTKRTKPAPPRPIVFSRDNDGPASGEFRIDMFDRSEQVEELLHRLNSPEVRQHVLTIAGVSGVGKSMLIQLLIQHLKKHFPYKYDIQLIDFYGGKSAYQVMKGAVKSAKQAQNERKRPTTLLILDQFELCLDAILRKYPRNKSLRELLDGAFELDEGVGLHVRELFLEKLQNDRLKIIVAVRSDRYYDLRCLARLAQIPHDAVEVCGLVSSNAARTVFAAMERVLGDEMLAEIAVEYLREDDGILPLKAQIAVRMLEEIRASQHSQFTKGQIVEYLSKSYLTERYFRRIIESAPDPRITSEVLYILAIEGRVKTWHSASEISTTIFRTHQLKDVEEALLYLGTKAGDSGKQAGVVVVSNDRYALAHDYFALRYRDLSGRLILPIVRDNLSYSAERILRRKGEADVVASESAGAGKTSSIVLKIIAFTLVLFASYRLSYFRAFVEPHAAFLNVGLPLSNYSADMSWQIDWQYLPIAILQCSWGIYVIGLIHNIFRQIECGRARVASYGLIVPVYVGIIWTALAPGTFVIWLGINGLLVGIKFASLGVKISKSTGWKGNRCSLIGFYSCLNAIVVIYIGCLSTPRVAWDLQQFRGVSTFEIAKSIIMRSGGPGFASVYYIVVPLMLYFLYAYTAHVRDNGAVQLVGLYKRVEAVSL